VLFISEPDIYRRIQSTYNYSPEEGKYRETEQDIVRRLIGARLLILDDLGKERRSDMKFIQRILFAIVDGRYSAKLPMVITTNLSQERLKDYLGGGLGEEATYDRLIEMTGRKFLRMQGESYRKTQH
jgi:DNA replication protein DnaC